MRIVFMGSPAFAVPSLKALHAAGHEILCVYTQPPRPAGRGRQVTPTAVEAAAREMGIADIRTPEKLKGEALEALLATVCDAVCVVAYGLLLPKALVDTKPCLNVHPSRLPRWRGAAPIQHTLMAGDRGTDVCIMKLDEGMDTGPVYSRESLTVPPEMTGGELHDLTATMGAHDLVKVLANLGSLTLVPQRGEATHAGKITPEMRRVDWGKPAETVHNLIRALAPAPGATTQWGDETLKLLGSRVVARQGGEPGMVLAAEYDGLVVACGVDAMSIHILQRPGRKALPVADALNGWGVNVGDVLR
jgi:methionyl-tRNA formyltransferase